MSEAGLHTLQSPLRIVRIAAIPIAGAWLLFEWERWPDGSALIGPLGFVWHSGPEPASLLTCLLLLAMMLAFPLKPSFRTLMVSLLGLLIWFFIGVLAKGIGC
jgi:hypothetical protein